MCIDHVTENTLLVYNYTECHDDVVVMFYVKPSFIQMTFRTSIIVKLLSSLSNKLKTVRCWEKTKKCRKWVSIEQPNQALDESFWNGDNSFDLRGPPLVYLGLAFFF